MTFRPNKLVTGLRELTEGLAQSLGVGLVITNGDGVVELAAGETGTQSIPQPGDEFSGHDVESIPLNLTNDRVFTLSIINAKAASSSLAGAARVLEIQRAGALRTEDEVDGLASQLLDAYEEINRFYQLADAFESARDEYHLSELLLAQVIEATGAEGGLVVLSLDGELPVAASAGVVSPTLATEALPRFPALEAALERCEIRNITPGSGDVTLDRPTVVAPLLVKGAAAGAVLIQKSDDAPFDSVAMKTTQSLSTQAGVFLNGLRQAQNLVEAAEANRQIELAETVQKSLLPGADIQVDGLELAAAYLASTKVGGDYYDFLPIAGGALMAVVADVSGHSLPSGLMMTSARSALQVLARQHPRPAEILRMLNDSLFRDLDQTGLFLSICIAVVDPSEGTVTYASAGHNPPFLWRPALGQMGLLESTGPLIGIIPSLEYEEIVMDFALGDSLVLYTDGITEARDPSGAFFGEDRLEGLVRDSSDLEAQGTVDAIVEKVMQHTAGVVADDVTLLVLKLAS